MFVYNSKRAIDIISYSQYVHVLTIRGITCVIKINHMEHKFHFFQLLLIDVNRLDIVTSRVFFILIIFYTPQQYHV